MSHVSYAPSNPHTTTREKFTENILNVAIPEDAVTDWASAVRQQQALYKALYEHEAMLPNQQQTFMTPANQKSPVYHLWDYVGRTLQYFYMVDYKTPQAERSGQEKAIYEEALGRTSTSNMMVQNVLS